MHTARKWQRLPSILDLYDSPARAFNYNMLLYKAKSMSSDWSFFLPVYSKNVNIDNIVKYDYTEVRHQGDMATGSLSTVSEKWKRSETRTRTGLWTVTAQETECKLETRSGY